MAKEVVILDKEEYQALINNCSNELDCLKTCQHTLNSHMQTKNIHAKHKEIGMVNWLYLPILWV